MRKAVESRVMIPALKAVLAARYNDPAWLATRHGIAAGGEVTQALAAALAAAAKAAAGP